MHGIGIAQTTSSVEITIHEVPEDSEWLIDVKELGKKNKKTLGYFPDGAFEEYAQKRHILGAIHNNKCVGYLLYAATSKYASITHLCIKEDFRGSGLTQKLFNKLKEKESARDYIRLTCRRDYTHAKEVWKRLDFKPIAEKPAKQKGKTLEIWRYNLNPLPLFKYIDDISNNQKSCIVIDSNIFISLEKLGNNDGNHKEELDAQVFQAEWLCELIQLHITNELFYEISRQEDNNIRKSRRTAAISKYPICEGPQELFDEIQNKLLALFPLDISQSDLSDLKQLAHAIAGNADFFVTSDQKLQNKNKIIFANFNLPIVSVAELVTIIHETEHQHHYQPSRIDGTTVKSNRLTSEDITSATTAFLNQSQKEREKDFKRLIEKLLSAPDRYDTRIIKNKNEHLPLAIWSQLTNQNNLDVPLIRLQNGSLKQTFATHLIWLILRFATENNITTINITDNFIDDATTLALQRYDFIRNNNTWSRLILPGIFTSNELKIKLTEHSYPTNITPKGSSKKDNSHNDARLEQVMWPSKIQNSDLSNFITPIRPYWASQLFDHNLASSDLFGAELSLMFGSENVYYRSAHQKHVLAPSRVLWYVSDGKRQYQNTKSIRACSQIIEICHEPANKLFKKFSRLGIYKWSDIMKLTNNNSTKQISAFRFSYTETFPTPVPFDTAQKILIEENGKGNPFVSPYKVSEAVFMRIYKEGMNL